MTQALVLLACSLTSLCVVPVPAHANRCRRVCGETMCTVEGWNRTVLWKVYVVICFARRGKGFRLVEVQPNFIAVL
jgi:hypothetical protein